MTGHYLFEAEFCNRAAGWEKGIVEKNVQDRRRGIWREVSERRWADLDELNVWVREACLRAWQEMRHPEWPELTVADVWQDEQVRLMPCPTPFNGYIEQPVLVSPTSLIHYQRNRYSVPCGWINSTVSLRAYPAQLLVVAADGECVTLKLNRPGSTRHFRAVGIDVFRTLPEKHRQTCCGDAWGCRTSRCN